MSGLLAILVIVTGCAESVDGTARVGSREVDPAAFFAGAVPTYGLEVRSDDVDALAYLRAIRRIDPCGLLTREDLAKIGEIGSVGTLFAFDECDLDVKVPGEADRRYLSVEITMTHIDDQPVDFRAAGLPVYDAYPGSCDYLLPYQCDFALQRLGFDATPLQVSLEPQAYDLVTETRTRLDRDGVEVFVDQASCTAATFVGAALRRKLVGGDFVATGDLVIRPAVVVDGARGRCDAAVEVAVAASRLYA